MVIVISVPFFNNSELSDHSFSHCPIFLFTGHGSAVG